VGVIVLTTQRVAREVRRAWWPRNQRKDRRTFLPSGIADEPHGIQVFESLPHAMASASIIGITFAAIIFALSSLRKRSSIEYVTVEVINNPLLDEKGIPAEQVRLRRCI
jgi:hypothetical protein